MNIDDKKKIIEMSWEVLLRTCIALLDCMDDETLEEPKINKGVNVGGKNAMNEKAMQSTNAPLNPTIASALSNSSIIKEAYTIEKK